MKRKDIYNQGNEGFLKLGKCIRYRDSSDSVRNNLSIITLSLLLSLRSSCKGVFIPLPISFLVGTQLENVWAISNRR